jgi:hypothetical protein
MGLLMNTVKIISDSFLLVLLVFVMVALTGLGAAALQALLG